MTRAYQRSQGGTLLLGSGILETMQALGQTHSGSSEAGGVLLGRMITESDDVVVDEVTLPTHQDKRGRFFFHRTRASGNKRIRDAWRESAGTRNYLGEWHTHPEDHPTPSPQDLWNWGNIMRKAQIEQDYLFFLILGRGDLVAWEWWKGLQEPIQLKTSNMSRLTIRRRTS